MPMTLATLVTGADAARREAAIAADIRTPADTAVILEGLPSGKSAAALDLPQLQLHRIAPACMCCTGNLTFRVTLDRVLRRKPARLYLGLASSDHLDAIRRFLSAAPYGALLELTPDLQA
ncbi:GTPase [Noviherbaspirillum aridicola]|uniref:GTPase n=1 Tax=Noviherbaspirillum aridicola TaxID=2849687 RepID=A0ABQ4Q512_9BURK|nr:GTPase [Noviherbaspirillum aridicola]GIZ52198.1 hypothetical protein NCCP691_22120 [Noviherbaspirillum aridicola]